MDYSEVVEIIVKNVLEAINKVTEKLPFDKSSEGKIMKILENHYYMVLVFGKEYKIYSSHDFKLGQRVLVTAPQNDFKRLVMTDI